MNGGWGQKLSSLDEQWCIGVVYARARVCVGVVGGNTLGEISQYCSCSLFLRNLVITQKKRICCKTKKSFRGVSEIPLITDLVDYSLKVLLYFNKMHRASRRIGVVWRGCVL